MNCSKPKLYGSDRLLLNSNRALGSFHKLSSQHCLEGVGIIHYDLSVDLHEALLQDRMATISGQLDTVTVLDNFGKQISSQVDLVNG